MFFTSCLYYCKDTLFEAIHNRHLTVGFLGIVVCITAKIHFLKQFTTERKVLPLLLGCLYYCKDTLFEAIHNISDTEDYEAQVVCITAKIHFLKQFTTTGYAKAYVNVLFVLLQRYTFWSNSQPYGDGQTFNVCCLYYCKDTLFEAIHNYIRISSYSLWLFVLLQRYTFWSNSQHCSNPNFIGLVVCITAKIHFLKQFTTVCSLFTFSVSLFVLLQRYTFWSNSQRGVQNANFVNGCLYYCKDTLFEAIHNFVVKCAAIF